MTQYIQNSSRLFMKEREKVKLSKTKDMERCRDWDRGVG